MNRAELLDHEFMKRRGALETLIEECESLVQLARGKIESSHNNRTQGPVIGISETIPRRGDKILALCGLVYQQDLEWDKKTR